jgi:predicted Zn-dependent protease
MTALSRLFFVLMAAHLFCFMPIVGHAKNIPPVIRDTEIEQTLKHWLSPLLKAAGMPPGSVNIILVQSNEINAFVAGGSNIFIYTGLIEKTDTPDELIGVMAHELGHIAGGHLIRAQEAMEHASFEAILGTVIGVGAAVLTGNGALGSAIMSGAQGSAMSGYLSHSRVQESAADQAGITYMVKAGYDPRGIERFLQKLGDQELVPAHQQVEYVRTHPLTSNRLDAVVHTIKHHGTVKIDVTAQSSVRAETHARLKAKIIGFTAPNRVQWAYGQKDDGTAAQLARCIAAYQNNNTARALKGINALIKREPQNPYFHELKGQMLIDFGRVNESLLPYKTALDLLPRAGLIRMAYGRALLADGKIKQAIKMLERAAQDEPRSSRIFRLLATAYGKLGHDGAAKTYLAEEALLHRRYPQAKSYADSALKLLKPGSQQARRAQDILVQVKAAQNG